MSNKTLLSETQIRQFMKLAKLEPLTPGFVHGLRETYIPLEEEDPAELEGDIEHDLGDDSLEGDEEALDDEDEIDAEMDAEMDVEPEVALEDQMINVQDLMAAITAAITDVTGVPAEASIEDEPVEDEPAAEVEMDAGMDAVDDMEAAPEMGDEMLEETDASKIDEDDEKNESTEATDELVEQITKRVAARILKSALAKK